MRGVSDFISLARPDGVGRTPPKKRQLTCATPSEGEVIAAAKKYFVPGSFQREKGRTFASSTKISAKMTPATA